MHGRVRHGDCRARGGDLDQLKPSLNFGLVYAARWLSRASRPHVPHRPLRFALLGASKCPNEAATAIWLHVNYAIDYVSSSCYRIRILAHRGASPETIPKAERGVASCGRRLVTARPGRPGKSPASEELAARTRRQMPAVVGRRAPKETEARPRGQNRHGGAPRGERPASWQISAPWRSTSLH